MGQKVRFADFLKSRKGGISNILFEVVIMALALSLMISVIYLFRGNMDIISTSAQKANDLEKVEEQTLVPLDKDVVNGGDVISVIRYYAGEPVPVEITVKAGASTYVYSGRNYDSAIEAYRDSLFDAEYVYDSTGGSSNITKIVYTLK